MAMGSCSAQNYRKSPISYRPEIDGLRALAIILVLLVHFFPKLLPGAFIGVDIFFVISGFLITSIILKQLQEDIFSFQGFYVRRANRIFPALILVLFSCYVFGWLGLYSIEFKALGKSIAAGAGFIANIFFYNEVGYWDRASELKPLLHLWSLGVEEQFYLAWPIVIVIFFKSKIRVLNVCVILIIFSFAWNLYSTKMEQASAFYLPFSRLWELLSGGMIACWLANNKRGADFFSVANQKLGYVCMDNICEGRKKHLLCELCAIFGLGLIIYASAHVIPQNSFPGKYALFPVVGTVLIILGASYSKINTIIFGNRYMIYIGLISYPLYLWHWPILSFTSVIENGHVTTSNRIYLMSLSVILASATYHLVEKPLRSIAVTYGRKAFILTILLILCGFVGYYTFQQNGISARYLTETKNFEPENLSNAKDGGAIALLGDSHAGHLVSGLRHHYGSALFVEATAGWPYLLGTKYNINFVRKAEHTGTPEITKQAIDRLLKNSKIETVIVSNQYDYYIHGDKLRSVDENIMGETAAMAYKSGLIRTIKAFVEGGKKVVYVKELPFFNVSSIESCIDHGLTIRRVQPANCVQSYAKLLENRRIYNKMIDEVLNEIPQVKVFDTLDYMCDKECCGAVKDGILLYKDQSHLNINGSTYLGNKLAMFLARERISF